MSARKEVHRYQDTVRTFGTDGARPTLLPLSRGRASYYDALAFPHRPSYHFGDATWGSRCRRDSSRASYGGPRRRATQPARRRRVGAPPSRVTPSHPMTASPAWTASPGGEIDSVSGGAIRLRPYSFLSPSLTRNVRDDEVLARAIVLGDASF